MSEGNRTIWKFDVPGTGLFKLKMPSAHSILCAREQHGQARLWALVDPASPAAEFEFILLPTGVEFRYGEKEDPPGATTEHTFTLSKFRQIHYVDTVFMSNGAFVFHLFTTSIPEAPKVDPGVRYRGAP